MDKEAIERQALRIVAQILSEDGGRDKADASHTFIWDSEYGCPVFSRTFGANSEFPAEQLVLRLIPLMPSDSDLDDRQVMETCRAPVGSVMQQMIGHFNVFHHSRLHTSAQQSVDAEGAESDDAFFLVSSAISQLVIAVFEEQSDKATRISMRLASRKDGTPMVPPVAVSNPVKREIRDNTFGVTVEFSIYFAVPLDALETQVKVAQVLLTQRVLSSTVSSVDPTTAPTTAHLLKGSPYGPH